MPTPLRPTTVATIQCGVCLKEIPVSEAKSAEAADYVRHFCGLACYDLWRKQTNHGQPEDKK